MKYHDNTIKGNQYDENGWLLNNWDPDKKYPDNEYAEVHFRIRAKGFQGQFGSFESEETKKAFTAEKLKVFQSIGWKNRTIDNNGICMTVECDKQSLYLHPQDFSGRVLKNNIKIIAEALEGNETFTCEWVDVYVTVLDITEEEYHKYLLTRKEDAKREIFVASKTNRKNQYKDRSMIAEYVAKEIMQPRIGCRSVYFADTQTINFVIECMQEMIEEGYLDTTLYDRDKDIILIRSLNKTEMKSKKLPPIYDIEEED